jgi:predicted CopG family antitoxin
MATKTITVTEKAYRTLARCKAPGESFTQTIERELGGRLATIGALREFVRTRRGVGLGLRQRTRRKAAA